MGNTLPLKDDAQKAEPAPVSIRSIQLPQAPSYSPALAVSSWRVQVKNLLDGAGTLLLRMPAEALLQLMALASGAGAAFQRQMDQLLRDLTDPAKTDLEVAAKLKSVKDDYIRMRPGFPAPAAAVFDPALDSAINLTPADIISPETAGQINAAANVVPWGWVAGGFVAGLLVASATGRMSANRRRR
jgi:hypothetical protein